MKLFSNITYESSKKNFLQYFLSWNFPFFVSNQMQFRLRICSLHDSAMYSTCVRHLIAEMNHSSKPNFGMTFQPLTSTFDQRFHLSVHLHIVLTNLSINFLFVCLVCVKKIIPKFQIQFTMSSEIKKENFDKKFHTQISVHHKKYCCCYLSLCMQKIDHRLRKCV